jgi:hypothetical protein
VLSFFSTTGTKLDALTEFFGQFSATGYVVTIICVIALMTSLYLLLKRLEFYGRIKSTLKGLKDGVLFPKSNISLLRWTALVAALLAFVHSNYNAVVKGESTLVLDSNFFLIPLIVLLFAGLYKMAYLAAKDSSLAI